MSPDAKVLLYIKQHGTKDFSNPSICHNPVILLFRWSPIQMELSVILPRADYFSHCLNIQLQIINTRQYNALWPAIRMASTVCDIYQSLDVGNSVLFFRYMGPFVPRSLAMQSHEGFQASALLKGPSKHRWQKLSKELASICPINR